MTLKSIFFIIASVVVFNSAHAVEIKQKLSGTATLSSSSQNLTVNLPSSVDMSKSILFFSIRTQDKNQPGDVLVGGELASTTTIEFHRSDADGSNDEVIIAWQVLEFLSGISVQRGSFVDVDGTETVTITSVNTSQAFALVSLRNNGSTLGNDDGVTVNIASSTSLEIQAQGNNVDEAYWQVVECADCSVQKVSSTLSGATQTGTFTSVNTGKTLLFTSQRFDGNINADDLPRTELTNSTTLTHTRTGTASSIYLITYVVEFSDATSVQHGTVSFGSGDTGLSDPITAVTDIASFAISPSALGYQASTSYSSDDSPAWSWYTIELNSGTSVDVTRNLSGNTADIAYQVAEFPYTAPTTWYTMGTGGDWSDPTTWTLNGSGTIYDNPGSSIPGVSDNVEIMGSNAAVVTMDLNNVTIAGLDNTGELYLGSTTGHDFTAISGNGKIYLDGSGGADNFPDGGTSLFADPLVGGTVEYNGAGVSMSTQREFNNFILNLDNSTDVMTLLNDLTVNSDFTLTRGTFQINDNSSTTILDLDIGGDALVATNASISVGQGDTRSPYQIGGTMPGAGSYHDIFHQVTFNGDFSNQGTVQFTNQTQPVYDAFTTTGAATVIFSGNQNNTASLFGTTDFYNLIIDKGTDQTFVLEVNSDNSSNFALYGPNNQDSETGTPFSSADPEIRKALWIYHGTLELTGNIIIPSLTEGGEDYIIGGSGAIVINSANVEVYSTATDASQVPGGAATGINTGSGNQALTLQGKFQLDNGTFGTRNSAGFIFRDISAGNVIINGGSVNVSQFRSSVTGAGLGTLSYTQTGGEVLVRKNISEAGELNNDYALFSFSIPEAVFNMSGGTLTTYGKTDGGTIFINSNESNYNVTGGNVVVEIRDADDPIISTKVPFWNLTLNKNGGGGSQAEIDSETSGGETILDPDLIVLNNLTINDGVTLDHNGNDVDVGSDFVISSGGDYVYDASKTNTTTINGVDDSNLAFYNRDGGSSDEQRFWNLVINKPSDKTVTLISGKTGSNLEGNDNNLLRIDGGHFKVLSGTLDQGVHSIRVYTDTLVNYDNLTVYDPVDAGTDSNPNSDNDLIKFRPDPFVLITADTSEFGNVRLNNGGNIVTLVSDVYLQRMEYRHGRIDLKDNNLKIDNLFINLNGSQADWNSCGGCNSVEDMLLSDGNASDGGLSLYVSSNATYTFPVGIGTDGIDTDLSGGNSKYTPANVTVSNYSDDGYITIRPVDKVLTTTNNSGDILSYYWRVDYSDFTTLPTVAYQFTYYDDDLDGSSNESSFVPGKVLDDIPFTRSFEDAGNLDDTNNTITFNGDTGSGASPFTLEEANYTAGESSRFTGQVKVYYTRVLGDAAQTNWRTASNWTEATDGSYTPHDSRQPAAATYPQAGDIAFVGWVPWGDTTYTNGKPHGIEIDNTETFAELRFTPMEDISGNPTARDYAYNFQFRPTVCINPNGVMNAAAVRGEGAFWMRSTGGGNHVDPDFSSVDLGEFAREDSAYMIYESTSDAFVYDNIPSEVPNLLIAGNGWGANDRDFEISTDVIVKENFELLGDVNLVLSSGVGGDIYVEGDLEIIRLDINGNDSGGGGEIAFPDDAARTIEVLGDLSLINSGAVVNIRSADATVVTNELIVHGNIYQDNTSGGGLQLSSGSGVDHIDLTLTGTGNHSFSQISGADASFYNVTVNKGTNISSSFSFDGNFTLDGPTSGIGVAKALTLENGSAILNNASISIDLTTGDDDFNIPSSAALQVTQGTVNVSGDDSGILLDGYLIIDGGTVNMDDPAGNGNNYIEYSSSGSATIEISSGSLIVGSQIRTNTTVPAGILTYTQTGGTVLVGKYDAPEASTGVFEVVNTGSSFTYTGGTLTIASQNTASPSVAALRILPTFSDVTETIYIGNTDSGISQDQFGINANVTLAGLTIGGANNPTAVLEVNELTLSDVLTINSGATLDGNGIALTLQGDFTNEGTYTPNSNVTTFNSESAQNISGGGTTAFYDLVVDGSGTLNTSISFAVNNDFTLSQGIFDDNSNSIDLLGNVEIDGTHQSTGGTGDGLRFSGAAAQQLTRSSSGSSTLGIVTIQNSNGVNIPEGNGYNFSIDGDLQLNGGVFNIGSSEVTIGENAGITTSTAFSVTNMVKTNSTFSDNGLIKVFPIGYSSVFVYPVGESKYTPVTMDFSVSGGTSGTTLGSIAVRPANEYHPTINDGIQGMPSEPDINNVLQYYWTLRASNLNGFTADIILAYDQADVSVTESGYSEADYIPARILSFSNPTNLVNKYDVADLDETNNEITFSAASVFNGVGENGVSGDYFAGIDEAIPDNVATYTVDVDGGSVAGDSYDNPVPGGGAPSGAVVVVPNGFTLDFDIDNIELYKTEIQNGGVLEINDTEFHRLGILEGTGTLKIVHNAAGNPSLPAADYGSFFSCSGGSVEYGGTGSYTMSFQGETSVRNLTLSGSGTRSFTNTDHIICEDLIVNGPTVNVNTNRSLTVNNYVNIVSGVFNAPSGTTSRFNVNGDFDINGGTFNGSTSGITNVTGTTSLNLGTLNIGSSNYIFRLWENFDFTGGTFNGGSNNAVLVAYAEGSNPISSVITGDFTGTNAFYNLEIDKGGTGETVTLNGNIEIANSLLLTDAIVDANGNNVTIGASATVTPESGQSNSYINGRVIKNIASAGGSFTFPVGSANQWRPAYVENVSTGGLDWEAEYFAQPATVEPSVTNFTPTNGSIETMSSVEYWSISDGNAAPSGVTATVGLSWGTESFVSTVSAEREQMEVMVWNGATWDNYGGANFSSGHSQSQGTLNSSSAISFSENIITLGSTDLANPLPVELVSFTGKESNGEVVLSWQTASELNNDYFVVEHSVDGNIFTEVGEVGGAGTTTLTQNYKFTHARPVYPYNYYRLKQVDFDGSFEYSDVILVKLNQSFTSGKIDFVMYPNPTSGDKVKIRLNSVDFARPMVIEVVNLSGKRVYAARFDSLDFFKDIELDFGYGFTRGIYIVKMIQEEGSAVKRLVLK